jgi:predicted ArsR family transcriptional regulator
MTVSTDALRPALASGISDRAFRLYCVIVLRTNGEWVPIPPLAEQCSLTAHQVRLPLAELRAAGMIERDRRYERGGTGRKTWHTYVRLSDGAGEVAA